LSAHVATLTEVLQGDSKHQLAAIGDLRGRLRGELKSLDEAVDVVRELREVVTAGLADRDERRAELGSVMKDLAEEVRSLRRAIAVPSKAQAAKRERDQAKAIADAVAAALGGVAANGPPARASRRRG
jgi:septal ring factor EnvC (AmiA/AmiB activator)